MAEDRKPQPIPVGSGERVTSIAPASNSFAARGAGLLTSVPEWHKQQFDSKLGIKTETQARLELAAGGEVEEAPVVKQKPKPRPFGIGDKVLDTQRNMKVMILQTNVGRTNKGNPVHLVIHRTTGEEWRLPESKMTRM